MHGLSRIGVLSFSFVSEFQSCHPEGSKATKDLAFIEALSELLIR